MNEFRIKLLVSPDGKVLTALESKSEKPVPLSAFAFFTKIEPAIERFKRTIKSSISAQAVSKKESHAKSSS